MVTNNKYYFDIHPSVVYQLGESLISDSVQALIELVKNSYDADATYSKVIIDTEGVTDVPGAVFLPKGGRIIVEDDGCGMDLDTIESGWLLISNRKKRELKEAKKTTPGGRTPLGDKGLGRLGVQRIGEDFEIFTKSIKESGYHFAFSWLDFATAPRLGDIDIHLQECQYPRPHGTKVVISGLREVGTWRGEDAIKRLQDDLSHMISPFDKIRDFEVFVEVDGKSLELIEITNNIRKLAPIHYHLSFDGEDLIVSGKIRLNFFRPNSDKEAEQFALLAEADNGKAFFDFLSSQSNAKRFNIKQPGSKSWFVEFSTKKALDNLDGLKCDEGRGHKIANPGPFEGEIDSFDYGRASFQQQNIWDSIADFRMNLKKLCGIRVYRDGFAIRVDHDWLRLGTQWTSARSYYGLKPDNTLGYIALTARDNMDLEETTDREGFRDSSYYQNFSGLLNEFIHFTANAHNFFGRSWSDFRKKRNEEFAKLDTRRTIEDISKCIKDALSEAEVHRKALTIIQDQFTEGINNSRIVVNKLVSAKEINPKLKNSIAETIRALEPIISKAGETIPTITQYLAHLASIKSMGQVLEDRIDSLKLQVDEMYETVALGLTAEALSHEVFSIAEELGTRSKRTQVAIRNSNIINKFVISFVEYVNSAVIALRKQISFLSPSLRYVREQKEVLPVSKFMYDLKDFYSERLADNAIELLIEHDSEGDFAVLMNRGKLSQIINNFMLNSEYWLIHDMHHNRIDRGIITIEVAKPFVRVSDNGRGIDPSIENSIFEPFVSAKRKPRGRGLGLFIVKQLLDSECCHVGIIPERNKYDRLYKFQIDFRGAMNE